MSRIESRLPKAVVAEASATTPIGTFPITKEMSTHMRVDCYVGKVEGTGSIKLQDSAGFSIWHDVKSVSLTASTDLTCTISTSTGTITSADHGLSTEDPISFATSASLPDPLLPGAIYYVEKIDKDTFRVKAAPGNSMPLSFKGGSGTHTATKLRVFSITVQCEVEADQAYTPLKEVGRVIAVMGSSQTCQVCAVKVS